MLLKFILSVSAVAKELLKPSIAPGLNKTFVGPTRHRPVLLPIRTSLLTSEVPFFIICFKTPRIVGLVKKAVILPVARLNRLKSRNRPVLLFDRSFLATAQAALLGNIRALALLVVGTTDRVTVGSGRSRAGTRERSGRRCTAGEGRRARGEGAKGRRGTDLRGSIHR